MQVREAALKNLSPYFYEGIEYITPIEVYNKLVKFSVDLPQSIKFKTVDIRDSVELNQLRQKENLKVTYALKQRRGYNLAIFTFE